MRYTKGNRGYTLVEAMIAVLVLTIGLTGVAKMQINAMNQIFFSNAQATGSDIALAWTEWLNGLISHQNQEKPPYYDAYSETTKLYRENFSRLVSLDADPTDTSMDNYDPPNGEIAPFTEIELPKETADIIELFNGTTNFTTSAGQSIQLKFRKDGEIPTDFTAEDMPPPAPPGARLLLRIAANVPVADTATIEVVVMYANAFVHERGATLRLVVGSNM